VFFALSDGLFKAVESTLPTTEYVYERLNTYNLSHIFLMRQLADLSGTPIAALAGDAVIDHFRKIYHGQLILNVGISREHATELVAAGLGDFVAFGREYIANPDLVERIRLRAPLNKQRPEGYYGATAFGYTDYPFLTAKDLHAGTEGASLSLMSGVV
jgi:N-ethylmaleimide reductase